MKRRPDARITLTLVLALLAVVGIAAGAPPEEPPAARGATAPPTPEDGGGEAEDSTPGAAGMRVYLDPDTGELRSRPADPGDGAETGRVELTPHERLNTYGGDLLQERLERGGFKVDLRGRFQRSVVVTIDPQTDEVSIDCVSDPATVEPTDEGEAADGD